MRSYKPPQSFLSKSSACAQCITQEGKSFKFLKIVEPLYKTKQSDLCF